MQVMSENKVVPKLRFENFSNSWDISKFDTYCNFQQGVQVDVELHKKKYEDGYIKFLRIENYTQKSNDFRFIPDLYKESKRIDEDDIVVVRYGATAGFIGRGFTGILANNLFKIIPDKNIFNKDYLYQYLISFRVFKFFQSEMAGGAMPALSFGIVKHLKVPITSIPEQQKIASFLSVVDEKLQQLTKKKELLEEYKKGVMQKIFSQELRFRDDNGNSFPDWEEKKLGEIAFKTSSSISANNIQENFGEYVLYGASGILKKVDFYREENPYISIVKDGAGVGRVLMCEPYSSVLGTLDMIKPKESNDLYFIYTLLQRIYFERYTVGSTIPHIYFKDYSLEKIKVPFLEEQKKIAKSLSFLDRKIELVSTQIENTKSFKNGLLQQMFV